MRNSFCTFVTRVFISFKIYSLRWNCDMQYNKNDPGTSVCTLSSYNTRQLYVISPFVWQDWLFHGLLQSPSGCQKWGVRGCEEPGCDVLKEFLSLDHSSSHYSARSLALGLPFLPLLHLSCGGLIAFLKWDALFHVSVTLLSYPFLPQGQLFPCFFLKSSFYTHLKFSLTLSLT